MGPGSGEQSPYTPSKRSYDDAVKQEVERLKNLHPTIDDIPSCLKLLETFTHCNSKPLSIAICDFTKPLPS